MRRLMEDLSSSKYMLSISFTTNLGNLRRCKQNNNRVIMNTASHFKMCGVCLHTYIYICLHVCACVCAACMHACIYAFVCAYNTQNKTK